MKSFFTTPEEMEDVELNITFTAPSFYGVGTSRLKYIWVDLFKEDSNPKKSKPIRFDVDDKSILTEGDDASGISISSSTPSINIQTRLVESQVYTINLTWPYWQGNTKVGSITEPDTAFVLTNGNWKIRFLYATASDANWRSLNAQATFNVSDNIITATTVNASEADLIAGEIDVDTVSGEDIIDVDIPPDKQYTLKQRISSSGSGSDPHFSYDGDKFVMGLGQQANVIFTKYAGNRYGMGVIYSDGSVKFLKTNMDHLDDDIIKDDIDESWKNTLKLLFINPIDGSNPEGKYFSLMTDNNQQDLKDEYILISYGSHIPKFQKIRDITEPDRAVFYLT